MGNDADRVEFRYRDSNNRIDLKCARISVPATWLTVSHISGPTLIQTVTRCREQRARVEVPEQTEQFASASGCSPALRATFTCRQGASSLFASPRSSAHGRSLRRRTKARRSVAETAQTIADTSRGSGEVALRTPAQDDIRDRAFAAAVEPAVPYEQGTRRSQLARTALFLG